MNREFQTPHTETMEDAVAVEQLYAAALEHLLKQKEAASVHSKAVQDATKAIEDARAEEERDKEAYETQCARLEEELRRLHAVRAQTVEAHTAKLAQLKATVKEHNDASAAVLASEPKLFFNALTCTEDNDMPDEQTEGDNDHDDHEDGSGMMLFTTYQKGEWKMFNKFPFEEERCLKCKKVKEINWFTYDGVSRYKQPCAECTEHKELEGKLAGTPQDGNLPEEAAPAAACMAEVAVCTGAGCDSPAQTQTALVQASATRVRTTSFMYVCSTFWRAHSGDLEMTLFRSYRCSSSV